MIEEKIKIDKYNTGKYILDDDGNPIPCGSVIQWGSWMEDKSNVFKKVICRTYITEKVYVSTVFMGLDHRFTPSDTPQPPILWETMVMGECPSQGWQERYISKQEAIAGHLSVVDMVRSEI